MADKELIGWVYGVQVVSNGEGHTYLLAWGENGSNILGCPELRPREGNPCECDCLVESGPLAIITPAAAIAPLPEEICLQICVHGKNGPVCLPWARNK
jgi:hypothetical protein